jgi:ribose transport system permease protein
VSEPTVTVESGGLDTGPTSHPDATIAVSGRLWRLLSAYSLVGLLLIVVVFFSLYGPTSSTYPTGANFRAIVGTQSVLAVVALAALVPLVCNEFDLSVGATAGVSSIFCASALSAGDSIIVAIAIGIAIGFVIGAVNAFVITRFGVNAVVTTLGMSTVLAGVAQAKTGGLSVVGHIPSSVTAFGSGNTLGIPTIAYAMIAIAILVAYLLGHTPFGRSIYAVGSNPTAAGLVGLRPARVLGWTFIVSGTLSGVAGVLQVARASGADPHIGESFTLPALAAAFLSPAAIRPGLFNTGGVLVAIFFLAALNGGLNLAGAANYISDFVNGIALILGVGLTVYLRRRSPDA